MVLTYGLETENLLVVPQNLLFSDYSLITLNFTLADQSADDSKVCYSRCVSEDTRDRFGAEIAGGHWLQGTHIYKPKYTIYIYIYIYI